MYLPQRKSNIISSLIVIPIVVAVMFGWFTNNTSIIKLNPSFPPMQFNTALCLLLLALVNLVPKKSCIMYSRCIMSFIVVSIAIMTLLEYLLSINLHIDNFFCQTFDNSLYPGRMAPNTAICFALLGIANIFPRIKVNTLLFKNLYATSLLTVVIITYIAILGYITDISYYFSWGHITGMALHTSICLLLLSATRFSFNGIKYSGQRLGVLVSSSIFTCFFMFWLYSIDYDDNNIRAQIDKNLTFMYTSLERKLDLEYSAIDRLYKRLKTDSYSSSNAIYADFQAYEDDYPSIYFIYFEKASASLFLSNYNINKNQALEILSQCNKINKNSQKLVCIQEQNNRFNVVFKPNFSQKVIKQFNRGDYSIEIYLEGEKIYSNLDQNNQYNLKIAQEFYGEKNWKIIAFFTTTDYEEMQRFFPSVFFILGVLISFFTQVFFHLSNINLRKNKILKASEQKLRLLNEIDSLTNVLNRDTLMKKLSNKLAGTRKKDSNLAVLFIDLDNFKYINDNYGHDIGDKILVETVAKLKNTLREDDLIARIGGDEFVVVLTNIDSKQTVETIVKRAIKEFEHKIDISNNLNFVQSISVGVTIYSSNNLANAEELIKQADKAMYIAKNKGKNQHSYFNKSS